MKEYSDPRMHSAEHILNQTMVRMFDCGRCFRAHIEKKKSKCDYHFDRPLTGEELDRIESKVNQVIKSDLPVREEFLGREEAQVQYNLERLPEDTGDRIRIIRERPAGSCCFEGVEDWYDPVLLLINLLLDVPLPSEREIPKACFFVGQSGCKLHGRYAFCVNFLCPKISAELKNGRLHSATGEELLCGWELEKEIRRRISSGTGRGFSQRNSLA